MIYKIYLSDNSFIIADDNYTLSIFNLLKKKTISVKELYDNIDNYDNYYLIDLIDNKKYKRSFSIEVLENLTEDILKLKIGSRLKLAKDIQINDLVVGIDGQPRCISDLHSGEDDMYEIEVNGSTYTVNGGHILELVDIETGEHIELPVNIYMHMNDDFKSKVRMEVSIT